MNLAQRTIQFEIRNELKDFSKNKETVKIVHLGLRYLQQDFSLKKSEWDIWADRVKLVVSKNPIINQVIDVPVDPPKAGNWGWLQLSWRMNDNSRMRTVISFVLVIIQQFNDLFFIFRIFVMG